MSGRPDPAHLPQGFTAAADAAGVKKRVGLLDLGLLICEGPARAAALFTTNRLQGAHIALCRDHLGKSGGLVRAVLVNSGNANCATGEAGIDDAHRIAGRLAGLIGCPGEQVLMLSTGVIGARLPVERIEAALPRLVSGARSDGFLDFARSILTTDTFPKLACAEVQPGEDAPSVRGCAKGAGMIHPEMATMLAFLLTDAPFHGDPRALLASTADRSFHRLSVDGDTSPNDTVLLLSSNRAGHALPPGASGALRDAIEDVAEDLCVQIARDGEGATRLVTVQVRGAASEADAARAGRAIATSPLVKTAIFGHDPNWGRILSAACRSGAAADPARARVWIGDADVYSGGAPHPENEPAAHEHLRDREEVVIGVDLAAGGSGADVWTCDFSPDYVSINADYRS